MKSEAEKLQHREQKRKWKQAKAAKVAAAKAEQEKHGGHAFSGADEARKMRSVTNTIAHRFGVMTDDGLTYSLLCRGK